MKHVNRWGCENTLKRDSGPLKFGVNGDLTPDYTRLTMYLCDENIEKCNLTTYNVW